MARKKARQQPTPEVSAKSLDMLSLFLAGPVAAAVNASLITTAAGAIFRQARERAPESFRTHPASTLAHRSLCALEERAVVTVAETVFDEHHLYPFAGAVRHHEALMLHRHTLSHPAAGKWSDHEARAFVDAKRDIRENPTALVWDLNVSINELLIAHGGAPHLTDFHPSFDSGLLLRSILEASCSDAFRLESATFYASLLQLEGPGFVTTLVRHAERVARERAPLGAEKS